MVFSQTPHAPRALSLQMPGATQPWPHLPGVFSTAPRGEIAGPPPTLHTPCSVSNCLSLGAGGAMLGVLRRVPSPP